MGNTPLWFVCPVARRNQVLDDRYRNYPGSSWRAEMRYPPGHRKIVRTGRTRPNPSRRRSSRTLDERHEYRCGCGHVGWTTNRGVLRYPVEPPTVE